MRLDVSECLGKFVAIERQDDVLARCALEEPLKFVARPRHRDHARLVALLEAAAGDAKKQLRTRVRILQDGRDFVTTHDRGDGALCRDLLGEPCRTKCLHCQPPPTRCTA